MYVRWGRHETSLLKITTFDNRNGAAPMPPEVILRKRRARVANRRFKVARDSR